MVPDLSVLAFTHCYYLNLVAVFISFHTMGVVASASTKYGKMINMNFVLFYIIICIVVPRLLLPV